MLCCASLQHRVTLTRTRGGPLHIEQGCIVLYSRQRDSIVGVAACTIDCPRRRLHAKANKMQQQQQRQELYCARLPGLLPMRPGLGERRLP